MPPEEKAVLDQHVQAIAKILYADADKSQMTNLGEQGDRIRFFTICEQMQKSETKP